MRVNHWQCFCSQVKRSQIRKGMVMVHPTLKPAACWEFNGDILVLHHPTTISPKYQAMGEFDFLMQQQLVVDVQLVVPVECIVTSEHCPLLLLHSCTHSIVIVNEFRCRYT